MLPSINSKLERRRDHKSEKRSLEVSGSSNKGCEVISNLPTNQLKEVQLGITEYVTAKDLYIQGVIKARYSDFHVQELDTNGIITCLSNIQVPECNKQERKQLEQLLSIEKSLITREDIENVQKLLDHKEVESSAVLVDVQNCDKEMRTLIHEDLKSYFGEKIISSTVTVGGSKKIEIKPYNKDNRNNRTNWKHKEQYTHFVLYKENIDTVQAISALAQAVRTKPANFSYAGTKDKRAKTTQWVSARQIEPLRLAKATKKLNMIHVGNFLLKNEPLKLGMLKGNHFKVAIRNVTASNEKIEECINEFKSKGFINYYGTQRFGNSADVPTPTVGKALLKHNFQLASNLIMKPREGDATVIKKMREKWQETQDAVEVRKILPKYCTYVEARLLEGYIKTAKTDHLGALNHLPRNMRMLYMHSYQSLIWNKIASKRIQLKGLNVCEGDLIYVHNMNTNIEEITLENEADPTVEIKDCDSVPAKMIVRPLLLNELDHYSIYDIVLPLVGHDIMLPENEVKQWYLELLNEDDLTLESLKSHHKIFSLAGAYRHLVIKPEGVKSEVCTYNKMDENLILSDFELLQNETLQNCSDGAYKALILEFKLPQSTYATMALREILKSDTSPAAQAQMSVQNISAQHLETEDHQDAKRLKTS